MKIWDQTTSDLQSKSRLSDSARPRQRYDTIRRQEIAQMLSGSIATNQLRGRLGQIGLKGRPGDRVEVYRTGPQDRT